MNGFRRMRGAALVLLLIALTGCYSYQPTEAPAPGTTVRVKVPIRSNVVRSGGEPQTAAFEGTLLALGDTVLLETKARREYGAFREVLLFDTLRVARADVTALEERLLSKPRTYAFTAALTLTATVLGIAAINAATGSEGGGKPGGTDPTTAGALILSPVLRPVFSGLLGLLGGG